MLRFSKWSFVVILQFFLLIIMSVQNIKQTITKDYNIQSWLWIAHNRFCQPFLLCTTFCSFLCAVHRPLVHLPISRKQTRVNKGGRWWGDQNLGILNEHTFLHVPLWVELKTNGEQYLLLYYYTFITSFL